MFKQYGIKAKSKYELKLVMLGVAQNLGQKLKTHCPWLANIKKSIKYLILKNKKKKIF